MTRPEPRRDSYGRYLLPDPTTGTERSFTRTTTLVKAISDTTALDKWKQRQVAIGLARRPGLLDLVADSADDRDVLNAVCQRAMDEAGAHAGADAGTLLHSLTEQVDGGELALVDVPEPHRADVTAYVMTMAAAGVEILPQFIERIVVNATVNAAGMFDRLVRLPDGRLVVGDLKTGKDLAYSWLEIAAQLATYAHADGIYNGTGYDPLPELDRTTGIIAHLPVGKATCALYEVDLVAGWAHAQLAAQVRAARARGRNLARPIDDPAEFRSTGVYARIRRARSVDDLADIWRTNRDVWTADLSEVAAYRKTQLAA